VDDGYRSRIHVTRKKIATGRSPGFMAEVIGAGTSRSAQDTAGGDEAILRQDVGLFEAGFVVQEVKNGEVKWPAYANDMNVSSLIPERNIASITLVLCGD